MNDEHSFAPDTFDPDDVGQANGRLFGLPFNKDSAQVIVIPMPWEVTVSYGGGTARGPQAILEASPQLDFHDPEIHEAWKLGICLLPIAERWRLRSAALRKDAEECIRSLEAGASKSSPELQERYRRIDAASRQRNEWLRQTASGYLDQGKLVAVLGGDHSSPLGLMQALADRHPAFGILQIDAHADLRIAYEGFEHSHASIMHNALELPQVTKLVPVGLRDVGEGEARRIRTSAGRICAYYDRLLKNELFSGRSWHSLCADIVAQLPELVYISFDIDGLQPGLCPGTGTPVPGGLEFDQAMYLIREVVRSGRRIVGFDLCEVAPQQGTEWDANVGARVLFALATHMAVSQGKLEFTALNAPADD